MNVNQKIKNALAPLKIPIFPDVCDDDTLTQYIVYNYADEYPELFSDDEPEESTVSLQIHYYVRGANPHPVRSRIAALLAKADFDVEPGPIFFENETKFRHCVLTAQIAESIENESEE